MLALFARHRCMISYALVAGFASRFAVVDVSRLLAALAAVLWPSGLHGMKWRRSLSVAAGRLASTTTCPDAGDEYAQQRPCRRVFRPNHLPTALATPAARGLAWRRHSWRAGLWTLGTLVGVRVSVIVLPCDRADAG